MARLRKAGTPKPVTKPKSKRSPGQPGRPAKGEEITFEEYYEALKKYEGKYIPAAEYLGCTITAVANAVQKNPALKALRKDRSFKRVEVALGVVDDLMQPTNKDKSTKLRAALFTLNTESPEHSEKLKMDGNLDVRMPSVNVNFVKPKGKKGE